MKDYPNRSKVVRGYMRGMPKLCYPVSSSIILPLNLPPQLRWDWMEVYGLQKDFGIACLICCGLICWPMSRVVYHHWVAWVSSGLRCILNVWDPTYDVCVCGSAILQSLHNERRKTVQDRRLVLYSPAVRVLRLWWDSMIAWGMQSWIATWVVRSCF